nr:hypothetical protein [Tanacetum cinerariifolium]
MIFTTISKLLNKKSKERLPQAQAHDLKNGLFFSPESTNEVDTASIQVSTVSTPVSTVSSHDNTANLSDATVNRFEVAVSFAEHESKNVLPANWECRSPRNQESRPRNQDISRKTVNVKDTSSKAMMAIDGAGAPQDALKDQRYFDSGCSRHMTRNISYLTDFKEHDGGYVAFRGGAKGGKITGKGTIKTVEKKVKIIRCDNEIAFKNKVMNEFCEEKAIKREYSMARTPRQNRVAERRNRTLIEAARTMLADYKLPIIFWAEAVNTACYVQNRVLVVNPYFKTPYELFKGRSPALCFMRPFRCHVTILNTLDQLGKFDEKSDGGIFVGYSTTSKAFRVYNIRTIKVEENLHITFLENKPMIAGGGPEWLFDIDALSKPMNYAPDAGIFDDAYDDRDEGAEADYNNLETMEPKKVTQALDDESWIEAMQEELLQFKLLNVWTLVDLPHGKRAIGTKWVYRNKRDQRGIVFRNKARIVAQGHRQEEGIDNDEIFAHVARIEAIRLFLACASFMDFIIYQIDVKSSFLYGTIEEEVFVSQPPGFVDPEFPNRVYKVEKSLYSLHQAPKACVKSASTPMETHKPLSKDAAGTDTKIHVDNESAICVVKNPVYHSMTKHIEIGHHFIRYFYEKRLIEIVKIHTDYNVVDLLTQAFDVKSFLLLLGLVDIAGYNFELLVQKLVLLGLKLKGYLINDGYVDLVQHADKKELAIPGQTATGKELSNSLMAGSLPKTTLPTQLVLNVASAVQLLLNAASRYFIPNAVIFEELARIGYEKPSKKLTFYKAFFSPKWKFFIHTILQCLSAITTSWNEFSSTMASAIYV